MKENEIVDCILSYLKKQGKIVEKDTNLFSTNTIDSMGVIELVIFIEEEIGVKLGQDVMRADNFQTVKKIAEIVKEIEGANE